MDECAIDLIEATDAHFAWLLDRSNQAPFAGLTQPADGVDAPDILMLLRGLAAKHGGLMWLIVCKGEVCGLCGYMKPPAQRCAEIGYGIAQAHRRRGLARLAVAAMMRAASRNGLTALTAGTSVDNRASQIVLERNGFSRTGLREDPEDGAMIEWRWERKEAVLF